MPVGSTWSKSRSAYCAANVWIAGSTIPTASSAKSPHGRSNEMPPALASNGCSQSTRPAPKWAGPILSRPKSHNHWAEVLGQRKINNVPLCGADSHLRIRLARPAEMDLYRQAAETNKLSDDGLAYLIELDPIVSFR